MVLCELLFGGLGLDTDLFYLVLCNYDIRVDCLSTSCVDHSL